MALTYNHTPTATPDWYTSTEQAQPHNHTWYYTTQDNINSYSWPQKDSNDERIKNLEEKLDLLTDVLITLITGMETSPMKIDGYQQALKLCIEKLDYEIMKARKEKSRVNPKKKYPDMFTDEDFEL